MPEVSKTDWRAALQKAVDVAADDPDAFVAEIKKVAEKTGISLEVLYQELQKDPKGAKKVIRNAAVQGVAKLLKRVL